MGIYGNQSMSWHPFRKIRYMRAKKSRVKEGTSALEIKGYKCYNNHVRAGEFFSEF